MIGTIGFVMYSRFPVWIAVRRTARCCGLQSAQLRRTSVTFASTLSSSKCKRTASVKPAQCAPAPIGLFARLRLLRRRKEQGVPWLTTIARTGQLAHRTRGLVACRPRSDALPRLRQSAGRARLDRALRERRRDARARAARATLTASTNTPTIEALTTALTALEGDKAAGHRARALRACRRHAWRSSPSRGPGRQLLVPDNVYYPTRRFCDETLPDYGVRDDLLRSADRRRHRRASRRRLAGSSSRRPARTPSRCRTCRRWSPPRSAAGVTTMIDNTWATPLIYRPLEHGIDLALYAGTKYQGGHSDLADRLDLGQRGGLAGAEEAAHDSRPAGRHRGDLADAPRPADHERQARAARAERASGRELAEGPAAR